MDKICFHENLLEPQCLLQLQRNFLGLNQERTAGTLQLFKDAASKHLMWFWVILVQFQLIIKFKSFLQARPKRFMQILNIS